MKPIINGINKLTPDQLEVLNNKNSENIDNNRVTLQFIKDIKELRNKSKINDPYILSELRDIINKDNTLFAAGKAADVKDFYFNLINSLINSDLSISNSDNNEMYEIDLTEEDAVANEIKAAINKVSQIVKPVLGIYETVYNCPECHKPIYSMEDNNFILFDKEKILKFHNKNDLNLKDCFEYYTRLQRDCSFYCYTCKKTLTANPASEIIYKLPEVLTVVLDSGKGKAYPNTVKVSEKIDLSDYVGSDKNTKLCLAGCIGHQGSSSSSGHYVAYIKPENSNQWFEYSDTSVKKVDNKTINNILSTDNKDHTKYILFYVRKNNNTKQNEQYKTSNNISNNEININNNSKIDNKQNDKINPNYKSNKGIDNISIDIRKEQLLNYFKINKSKTKKNITIPEENNIVPDTHKLFNTIKNASTENELKKSVNTFLKQTIDFYKTYSLEKNEEVWDEFLNNWVIVKAELNYRVNIKQNKEKEYKNILTKVNNFIENIPPKLNKIDQQQKNVNSLPNPFSNLNINNNNKINDLSKAFNKMEINNKAEVINNSGAVPAILKESVFESNDISAQFSNYTIDTPNLDAQVIAERDKPNLKQSKQTLTKEGINNLFPSLQDNNEGVLQIVRNSSDVTAVENAINKLLQQTIAFVVEYARSANKLCVNKFYNTWKECSRILAGKGPMFALLSQQVKNVITTVIETVCEFNSEKYYLGPEESK